MKSKFHLALESERMAKHMDMDLCEKHRAPTAPTHYLYNTISQNTHSTLIKYSIGHDAIDKICC